MNKQEQLVKFLASKKTWTVSDILSQELKLSKRTIRKYIQQINSLVNDEKIILSSPKGYKLNHNVWKQNPDLLSEQILPQTPKQRIHFLMQKLISQQEEQHNIYDLAEMLFVSLSTIRLDLAAISKELQKYELVLIQSGDYCHVEGREMNKRHLVSDLIENEAKFQLNDLFNDHFFLEATEIETIRKIIKSHLHANGYLINEFALRNLVLHLVIAMDRLQSKFFIENDPQIMMRVKNTKELKIAQEIWMDIADAFSLPLVIDEIHYTAILLQGNIALEHTKIRDPFLLKDFLSMKTIDLLEKILKGVGDNYLVDIDSEEFKLRFGLHLNNLLERISKQRFTRNPMSTTIKQNYPIIYDIAVYIAAIVSNETKELLPEDEIGFIAIHLGEYLANRGDNKKVHVSVIAPEYYYSSDKMKQRLYQEFSDRIVIDEIITEMIHLDKNYQELVLTTVPIEKDDFTKVVDISAFIGEKDIRSIEEALENILQAKNADKIKKYLKAYAKEEFYYHNETFDNKKEIITFLSNCLEKNGYVDEDFLSSVLEREEMSSTAFGNVAIPHSISMNAKKTAISILTSDTLISWGNQSVYIVVLIAINKDDIDIFGELFQMIISILDSEQNTLLLKRQTKHQQFLNSFFNILQTSSI